MEFGFEITFECRVQLLNLIQSNVGGSLKFYVKVKLAAMLIFSQQNAHLCTFKENDNRLYLFFQPQILIGLLPVSQHGAGGFPSQPVVFLRRRGFTFQARCKFIEIHPIFVLHPSDSAAIVCHLAAHGRDSHVPQGFFHCGKPLCRTESLQLYSAPSLESYRAPLIYLLFGNYTT